MLKHDSQSRKDKKDRGLTTKPKPRERPVSRSFMTMHCYDSLQREAQGEAKRRGRGKRYRFFATDDGRNVGFPKRVVDALTVSSENEPVECADGKHHGRRRSRKRSKQATIASKRNHQARARRC